MKRDTTPVLDLDEPVRGTQVLPRCIDSETLFAGSTTLTICHRGCDYQLRITRHGKLILTK